MQHSLCHSILSISELHCLESKDGTWGQHDGQAWQQDSLSLYFRVDCSIAPKDGTWGQNDGHTWRQDSCRILCVSLNFRVDCSASKDGTWVPHGHDGHRSHQDSCRIFFSLNFRVSAASQDASWGQDDGQASQQQDPCRILDCILHCTGPKDGSWGQDDRGPWQQDS